MFMISNYFCQFAFLHLVYPPSLHLDFDRLALVQGTIACWNLVETNRAIEDAVRLNPAFEYIREEFLDVGPDGRKPP